MAYFRERSCIERIGGNIPISGTSHYERPELGLINRLLARIRAWAIDDRLLAGQRAEGDPVIAARLMSLLDSRHRARIASALRRMVETARRNRWSPYVSQLPLQVREVLDSEPLILTLARELEEEEAISPRGVILADRLIRDGTSPIYWRCQAAREANPPDENVETAVRHARAALHLG
jgi:hypothetical protein